MTLSFDQKFQNYADVALKVGVGLQAGQRLIIRAPVESAPLIRVIVAKAYQMGATLVDVMWNDDAITLARFEHAPRDSFAEFPTWRTDALAAHAARGDALLSVYATDPDLLKGQDRDLIATTQRVGNQHMLGVRRYTMADKINWSIISYPVEALATKIFPTEADPVSKLWDAIFSICRADQPAPVAAWKTHMQTLAQARDYLNKKRYTALKYTAPGTDLTIGLPDGHRWHGGGAVTEAGLDFVPNVPTEEVFSLPHKDKVEGVVRSTKPLSYGGVLIDNFSLTFEQGKVVKVTAEQGEDVLRDLVATDEGSCRLGEVALVPHSSPISQSGVLFYNTLYDENATSHVALGLAYRFCMENGTSMDDATFAAAGGNTSIVHVDFMIGSATMDIDGVTHTDTTEPLMRQGEWVF